MNSRQRFLETIRYGRPDRVPYFEEGLRDEVLTAWRGQGLDEVDLTGLPRDRWEEIQPDLEPRPKPRRWPTTVADVEGMRARLDPGRRGRLPRRWAKQVRAWQARDHVLMLRVHRGFFLSVGVYGWDRLLEVVYLLKDDPDVIHGMMAQQAEMAAELTRKVLANVEIDAVVFTEPIGGNDGPLVSPETYAEFALASYEPVLAVCRDHRVETIVLRTYANARVLIPSFIDHGFNCLWACEVNVEEMDYRALRREFGRDLRLIGGIDLDVLRTDRDRIRREIEDKVPPLVADGGYVPLADGRVRPDVPLENYLYYRRLLAELTG